jgi:hypothetical protein
MIRPIRRRPPIAGNYRVRGFGDLLPVVAGGGQLVPLPAYANCDPRDVACVANNEALNTQYNLNVQQAQAQNNYDQCMNDGKGQAFCGAQAAVQSGGQVITEVLPAAATAGPQGGTFSFTTSRGGNAMQVGDSWKVSITGATPYMQVSVYGSMPGGAMPSTWEGTTDASGNFSKSGTVGTGEIGRWHEVWSVGPTVSGSTTFVVTDVTQAPAAPAPVTTPAGKTVINSSGATQQTPVTGPAAGGFSLAESFNCSDPSTCWFGFPKWAVLLAGGALAVFAFRGSHGR